MRIFGYNVSVRKAPTLQTVHDGRGFYPYGTFSIQEPFSGAYQRDIAWTNESVLAHHAVYACVTLISADIAKLWLLLKQYDENGIGSVVQKHPIFSRILEKPNGFQTRNQFIEQWVTSKLLRGNAYVYKEYDNRGTSEFNGVVRAMYVLDPSRVTPLVAPDGSVFYKLGDDNLSGIEGQTVPSDAIIHDRMNCLFHPLVGTSPIMASGTAANMGLKIQENGAKFFANDRTPQGVLTVPGTLTQDVADRISAQWHARDRSKIAVLPFGMTFNPITMTAEDSQVIEQLRYTGEVVCSAFHVPPWKIGIGAAPATPNEIYYSDCLQSHIEHMEVLLDEALGLTEPKERGGQLGVEFDLDGLLRMDKATQMTTLVAGVRGSVLTPNGARAKLDEKPLPGGDTIYMQHQDYPMEMVFNRTDLSAPQPTSPEPEPEPDEPDPDDDEPLDEDEERALIDLFGKAIAA